MHNDQPHLLIVDDDERIRVLLQKFLVRSGFLVTAARDAAHARDRHGAADVSFGFVACEARLRRQRQSDFERVEAAAKKQAVEDRRLQIKSTKEAEVLSLAGAYNAHAAAVRRHNTAMQRAQAAAAKPHGSSPARRAASPPSAATRGQHHAAAAAATTRSPARGSSAGPSAAHRALVHGRGSPPRRHLFDAASAAGAAAATHVRSPLPSVATGGRAAPRPPPLAARSSPPRTHFATDAAAGDPVASGLRSAKARDWHARHIAAVQLRWAKEQGSSAGRRY